MSDYLNTRFSVVCELAARFDLRDAIDIRVAVSDKYPDTDGNFISSIVHEVNMLRRVIRAVSRRGDE